MGDVIVNIKNCNEHDIYIGRKNSTYDLEESIWANPFVIGQHGTREEVIEKYELWLNSQPQLLRRFPEIKGKILGCWCAPQKCHGEVLKRLSDSKYIRNWFSNMLPMDNPIVYDGIHYLTVENFYQAMKLPSNEKGLRQEIALLNPFEAKKQIRDRDRYLWRSDWSNEMALNVMKFALRHKFGRATKFAGRTSWYRKLMITKDLGLELVEWANWPDLFWARNLQTGKGENMLGKILMEIRDE